MQVGLVTGDDALCLSFPLALSSSLPQQCTWGHTHECTDTPGYTLPSTGVLCGRLSAQAGRSVSCPHSSVFPPFCKRPRRGQGKGGGRMLATAGPCKDLRVTLNAMGMGDRGRGGWVALSRGVTCSDLCLDMPSCWTEVEWSLGGAWSREPLHAAVREACGWTRAAAVGGNSQCGNTGASAIGMCWGFAGCGERETVSGQGGLWVYPE